MCVNKWNKRDERERLLFYSNRYQYISTKTSLETNVGLTDRGNS